jgi:hypothetical protein
MVYFERIAKEDKKQKENKEAHPTGIARQHELLAISFRHRKMESSTIFYYYSWFYL